jgi:hypothetical protein
LISDRSNKEKEIQFEKVVNFQIWNRRNGEY